MTAHTTWREWRGSLFVRKVQNEVKAWKERREDDHHTRLQAAAWVADFCACICELPFRSLSIALGSLCGLGVRVIANPTGTLINLFLKRKWTCSFFKCA